MLRAVHINTDLQKEQDEVKAFARQLIKKWRQRDTEKAHKLYFQVNKTKGRSKAS